MAPYNWSQLSDGQSITFTAGSDVLHIDDATLSAADFGVSFSTTTTGPVTITGPDKDVTLSIAVAALATSNFTFADGSLFLVGDNTTATASDSGANTLNGGSGDDRFYGLGGADTLNGNDGNDFFSTAFASTNFGNDTVNGGNGTDTLSFNSGSSSAVTVDMSAVTKTANGAQGNITFTSIEVVLGTAGNDSFIGGDSTHSTDASGNRISERFRGNDGNDTINGGDGTGYFTIADYANNSSTQAISVDLHAGTASDGRSGTDTLIDVDSVRGGSGNDLIVGGSQSRGQSGTFFEQFRGNGGDDTINGGNAFSDGEDASSDRVDYSNNTSSQVVVLNLALGTASDGLGGTDTLIGISQGVGGAGDDTLTGDDQNNNFSGEAGNDTLDGGVGSDTARYESATERIIANMSASSILIGGVTVAAGTVSDGLGGTDTLINMENIHGSSFDDYIRGSDDPDLRQFFTGDIGNDTIDGGDGIDFIAYGDVAFVLGGITATLNGSAGTINDLRGGTDTLINVEGVSGTHNTDSLTGGSGDQWFRGLGGNDTINGGADNDWVSYSNSPSGVTVNLATGTATDGWNGLTGLLALGGTDTLSNIENVEGSDYADTITGSDGANELRGREGNDTILGGLGNDTLRGGDGNDSLDGGADTDTVDYSASTGAITASLLANTATDGTGGTDTFASMENLLGGAFADTLTGDGGANTLAGGGANDTLAGGDGTDTADYATAVTAVTVNLALGSAIDGQGGTDALSNIENARGSSTNDTFIGNASANSFDGNGGTDVFAGGAGDDTYTVDGQSDLVFEQSAQGTDTISSSASFYLYANVENLTLTGSALFGVGNNLVNVLTGNAQENLLIGWDGNDTIDGGAARDALYGVDGDDTIYGQAGIDYIVAGTGNDTVYAGNDADEAYGQEGNDALYGGDDFATDILVGGAGNDTIDGGQAWDLMYGNDGDDTYYVSQQVDWAIEQLNEGTDTVIADSSNGYYLYANLENLTLIGTTPYGVGNELDNTLTGNASVNLLLGGLGNDRINGAGGNDVLYGEGGTDTFVFLRGTGGDVVADFAPGTDKVEIAASIYANYAAMSTHMLTNGGSTAIDLGSGDFIILLGVTTAQLSSGDFLFA